MAASAAAAVGSSFSPSSIHTLKCMHVKHCPSDHSLLKISPVRTMLASLSRSNYVIEPLTQVAASWRVPRVSADVAQEEAPATSPAVEEEELASEETEGEADQVPVNTKLYFGNLPYNVDSAQLGWNDSRHTFLENSPSKSLGPRDSVCLNSTGNLFWPCELGACLHHYTMNESSGNFKRRLKGQFNQSSETPVLTMSCKYLRASIEFNYTSFLNLDEWNKPNNSVFIISTHSCRLPLREGALHASIRMWFSVLAKTMVEGVKEEPHVLYHRDTGRSRGFAFVTMSSLEDCNAVIENLDGSVTSESLTQAFQEYGNVVGARVLYDGETGKSRGYGFVCYSTKEEMETALQSLNGVELEGRALRVSLAEGRKS
ncbi:hypothetical protein OIU78_007371 [Salix suchowensis]|nr:hypothetical protein OIU78_007371 [Salix suchowensis]